MKNLEFYRVAYAARMCGLTEGCLRKAISRGAIPYRTTLDGLPLLRLSDVKKFSKQPMNVGRPRAGRKDG